MWYKGACIILGKDEYDQLIFAQIDDIYVINYKILLQAKPLQTIEYNDHLHSFTVCPSTEPDILVWSFNLTDHQVYGLYSQPITIVNPNFDSINKKFIVLK